MELDIVVVFHFYSLRNIFLAGEHCDHETRLWATKHFKVSGFVKTFPGRIVTGEHFRTEQKGKRDAFQISERWSCKVSSRFIARENAAVKLRLSFHPSCLQV